MQHSQRQADHLQVLATGGGADVSRLGSDIVYDGSLQPRNEKMCAFVHDGLLDSGQTVEDYCASAAFDIV